MLSEHLLDGDASCSPTGSIGRLQAAWEKLHTGCWKDVAPAWRDAYALACLLRALLRLSRLHASISAGNHLPCKAAISQRQSRASEGACQPKNGQQGGEHAHSSGHMSSTKAWHVLLADEQQQGAAAQSCLSCAEEATSLQQDLQDTEPAHVQRRIYHEQECLESITGQQTRLNSDSSLGSDPIKAAMHELDLGIMMGGHAFQERLHAAIATAQSAWRGRSGAGGTAAVTQSESRIGHLKIGIDQDGHLQREEGRKRKKLRHEADPVACVNSDENQHCTLRVVKQDSQPVAAWATSDISEEELHALVQQLPPGAPCVVFMFLSLTVSKSIVLEVVSRPQPQSIAGVETFQAQDVEMRRFFAQPWPSY